MSAVQALVQAWHFSALLQWVCVSHCEQSLWLTCCAEEGGVGGGGGKGGKGAVVC